LKMKWTRIVLMSVVVALALAGLMLPTPKVNADFGTGWSAVFFNTPDLTGTGTAPIPVPTGLNFRWEEGPPNINGVPVPITGCPGAQKNSVQCSNGFSARFTSVQTLAPGLYNFVATSDDGIRVNINGQIVLDRFVPRPETTDQFQLNIPGGQTVMIVEYFESTSANPDDVNRATLQFQWFAQGAGTPGTPGTFVFFTPSPPPPTAIPLTFSLSGSVRGLAIRTGPYLGGSLIGVLRAGQSFTASARNTDEGGPFTWYLITTNTGSPVGGTPVPGATQPPVGTSRTGWVSGRYLVIQGDPNLLPLQSTVFEQLDNPPETGVIAVPRSVMNLRRRPSQRSQLLGQIPWGAELPLYNRTVQEGRHHWLQVRYEGQLGWIFAPFVGTYGNLDNVPIR
jgi:hypothetical protein